MPLNLEDASGRPGEIVEVGVRVGFELPARGMVLALSFDPARLRLVGYSTGGTVAQEVNPVGVFFQVTEPGRGFVGIATATDSDPDSGTEQPWFDPTPDDWTCAR